MAAAFSSSSSSSTITPPSNYEVFLSFRGETRENFTSHLFAALSRKQIHTFMDEAINKGDKISPQLLNDIIEGSRISVIIFSKDYASSNWCLDELVKILGCKEKIGQIVIPVFYHVHPSDMRKQTGIFGKAFRENTKKFNKMPEKVQKWREALTEASYLAGHESTKIRPEAKLVDVIVKDVSKKLEDITVSTDSYGLVGINSQIEQLKSLLCIGMPDFRIVGIWGMGGIGKTTLAEAIFNRISNEFESKYFMANIREESKRHGLGHLRERVLSKILEEDFKIQTPNLTRYIKERLKRMKVVIVLDDVSKVEQLEYLAGGLDQFGAGSRIIITTRDKQVFEKCGEGCYVYEVQRLNYWEALKHFCNHAFRENHRPADLMVLSKKVVNYANGNPLALKVLGSFFYRKNKRDWEDALENLKLIFNPSIYDILKISYDNLSLEEQNIFLDIACFFKGYDKDRVTSIFDDAYSIHWGLRILVDKSLITISCNILEMHDLLQEMGQEIVCQESVEEPEKRSRLWHHKDILHVLNKNKRTDSIKGIFLDMSKISDINLDSKVFTNMSNLRLLKFYMPQLSNVLDVRYKVHLPQGLQYLSDELKYLYWHGYPLKMLPENYNPKDLIELSLPCSKIEQLWKDKKKAPKLKYIDLQHSQYVTGIPDLLEAPKLERVNLGDCGNLSCISSSIQKFNYLGHLSLSGCTSLKWFPPNIHFGSPITIDLSDCVNLTEFPQISGKIMHLNLWGTAIEEVPSSIESLIDLKYLSLGQCKRLKVLSTSICKLKSLRSLYLYYCSQLESFPEILEKMECLRTINLSCTAIKDLPSSFENVVGLQSLAFEKCSNLHNLPQNLGNLKSLLYIHGRGSRVRHLPSSVLDLNKVVELFLSGCRGFVLSNPLWALSSLEYLRLADCALTEVPQDIGCLSSLNMLYLDRNNFESLPTSIKHLPRLEQLMLSDCNMLQSLPELPPRLKYLNARNCKRLQSLPELPSCPGEVDTSVLEILSKKVYNDSDRCEKRLIFSNCMKLKENTNKNIMADSQRWIQHLAVRDFYLRYEEVKKSNRYYPRQDGVSLCFPGSQIPEWFSTKNLTGSSITIQLPPFCCNTNFIGFALCAVLSLEETLDPPFVSRVICQYRSVNKTFSETKYVDRIFAMESIFSDSNFNFESDHVCLGFDPGSPDVDHNSDVSFDFYVNNLPDANDKNSAKVKCCGVCPLYAHPIKTKPNTFTVNMLPPTEQEYKKLHTETNKSATTSGSKSTGTSDEEDIHPPQQQHPFLCQIFRNTKSLLVVTGALMTLALGVYFYNRRGVGGTNELEEASLKSKKKVRVLKKASHC